MKTIAAFLGLLFLSGCASVSSLDRPSSYFDSTPSSTETSLLSNASSLSNAEIEDYLNHRIKLPKQSRIALLKVSDTNAWSNYSGEFNRLNQTIAQDVIGKLRHSQRVYDASYLPSMLVPNNRSIQSLRVAAARFQADLLLAYRESCQTFEKYRFIKSDETKAYCTVEAVLLDIRSGVIPFTMVASNHFTASKQEIENNFRETIKKAELNAIGLSLAQIAEQASGFLDRVEIL